MASTGRGKTAVIVSIWVEACAERPACPARETDWNNGSRDLFVASFFFEFEGLGEIEWATGGSVPGLLVSFILHIFGALISAFGALIGPVVHQCMDRPFALRAAEVSERTSLRVRLFFCWHQHPPSHLFRKLFSESLIRSYQQVFDSINSTVNAS